VRATGLQAQCTRGLVSHAAEHRRAPRYSTRFLVRVRFRSILQASVKPTASGLRIRRDAAPARSSNVASAADKRFPLGVIEIPMPHRNGGVTW
jgi:hypothetical protein